mmetsp:Transcript_101145/g.200898  ORF Transcript_101145/g.200898 Transcript_101145/m.200898 type:complete len:404 (+) Transcript_101145:40-1251(+)
MLSFDAPHVSRLSHYADGAKCAQLSSETRVHGLRHRGSALRPSSARAATKSPRNGDFSGHSTAGASWQRDLARQLSERRTLGPRLSDVVGQVWEEDCRRRLAEVRGSLDGVVNEMRLMARRIEGLEERTLAQQTAAGQGVQRAHELEEQLLTLAQQSDHKFTSVEDLQKRHAGKLRLLDQTLDIALQRLSQAEEGLSRQLAGSGRILSIEARLELVERRHQGFSATEFASGLLTGAATSNGDLQALEERVVEHSKDLSLSNEMLSMKVDNLMQHVALLASSNAVGALSGGVQTARVSGVAGIDVVELQRRLATLESQTPISDLSDSDGQQPQDAMRDLAAQVGRLKLQATSDEATLFGVEKRLQQLQYMVQQCCRRKGHDFQGKITSAETDVMEVPAAVAKEP